MTHIEDFECLCGCTQFVIKRSLNGSTMAHCKDCQYQWPLDENENVCLLPAEIHDSKLPRTTSLLDLMVE